MYSSGFPDLFATHKKYGPRWIEVKLPGMVGSQFTRAQKKVFPELGNNGTRIWILTSDSDEEYKKLFKEDNWIEYFTLKF